MTRPLYNSAGGHGVSARTRGLSSGGLLRRIAKDMAADTELRNSRELTRWAALLPHIDQSRARLIEAADFAIRLVVLRRRPRSWLEMLELWRLRRSVERNVHTRCPAFYLVRGLTTLILLAIPVVFFTWTKWDSHPRLLELDSKDLGLVALAGVIGSIVSLLTRVPEFAKQPNVSKFVLESIGFCKPLIGTAFSLFAYALLKAELIPFKPEFTNQAAVIAVLGFIAAFSERFIPDMIIRTEGQLGAGRRRRDRQPK